MLWFSNGWASPPQFIGVRLTENGGAPVLILLYPDGSQETETFDHEDALVEGAVKLHNELPGSRPIRFMKDVKETSAQGCR